MNEKLSITLPAEMIADINLQVEAGRYSSPSEMLERAMQALAREDEDRVERIAEIRAGIARSLADPRPPVPAKAAFERLHAYVDHVFSEK
jgi:Arc/MetJ-type ribon-helix-helix transcriptional regulator